MHLFNNCFLARLLLGLVLGTACRAHDGPNFEVTWKTGSAKTRITPSEFMWMSGYGSRNKPAVGKLTDLWAKVLVLEDRQQTRTVLITLDLIGIGRNMSVEVCKKIKENHGLNRSQIALCASHTHTGPALDDNLIPLHYLVVDKRQQLLIETYSKRLKAKILETVDQAINRLHRSTLSWGNGRATFAVNRRNNPEDQVPKLRAENKLKGPFDHDVPVLAVHGLNPKGEKGKLEAVVFGYACHATVLSFYQWSGDYPGFAQLKLEETNPGTLAMFWAGCGADQNPLPRRKVELAKEYGNRLATAVNKTLAGQMQTLKARIQPTYHEVDLPLSQIPNRKQIQNDSKSSNRFVASRAQHLLSQMKNGRELNKTYPYPVQTWQLGDQVQFITLGGEVVVDFAVRLKSELQNQRTWVAGYSNDVMAYIASRRILREGGYEGASAMIYYGLPAPWALESEEMIINEVKRQLKPPTPE
jgi:neutral ceramidase